MNEAEVAVRESWELLARSEAQLKLITNALPALVSYLDRDLRYVQMNQTYAEWFGRPVETMLGRRIDDVLGGAAPEIQRHLEDAFLGKRQHFEATVSTVWGERMVSITHVPDIDETGTVRGVVVQATDITERQRVEAALRGSEERMRIAQQEAGIVTWDWQLGSECATWGPGVERVYGRPGGELTPEGWLAALHPEDREATLAAFQRSERDGTQYVHEHRVVWPDGSVHWVSAKGGALRDGEGRVVNLFGIVEEITTRKLTERALMQTEKLAAVGRLAASIAHEINNPLESVTNLLYLSRESESFEEVREYLDTADRELRRVAAITNQTLRFHRQSTRPIEVTCEDLIDTVLSIFQGRIVNSSVQVEKRKRTMRRVLCFDGEVRQVLSNLVGNAIDAMHPTGGRLLIRSREGVDRTTGRHGIVLTIADTGPGMSPETIVKVFEPFYTTKGIGGTGLGLWISKEIIARHAGRILLRSSRRTGRSGTVFAVFLPFDAASRLPAM